MSLIRDQYNKVSTLHAKKVGKLKDRNEDLQKKLASTKEKRSLDLNGYQSDLENLEKRMTFYKNYITKLKNLVDKDTVLQK